MAIPSIAKHITATIACSAISLPLAIFPLNAAEPDGPDALISIQDAVEYQLINKIKSNIISKSEYDKKIRSSLIDFYLDRQRQTVWLTKDGLTPIATALITEIKKGQDYGLNVADINFPSKEMITGTPDQRAEAEIMMSRAVITYAKRARAGHFMPQKISRFLDNNPPLPDPLKILESVTESKTPTKTLLSHHPKHPQFWALKKKLDEIKHSKHKEEKLVKIPAGPTIQPYDRHPNVVSLRKRFKVAVPTRNGTPLIPKDSYDSELIKAVKEYQSANGLRSNGIINKSTRAKLNKDKPSRTKQILANMERWRWMPEDFGDMHVRVNIPEYLVRVTKNNKIIHQERVIIGKTRNPTPSFSDEMETIVFNPYWNVPQSIIWNEMGGVAPKGYESRVVGNRVFIRQPPGPRNALGIVKFLFPNKHSVYMHDTPTKNLFNRTTRAFSHGCMRLRDPLKMAEVILAQNNINRKSINAMVANGRNQYIQLNNKVPVHVTYFTAWVNNDGSTKYYNDIYGHDIRVTSALEGRMPRLEPKTKIRRRPLIAEKKPVNNGFISLFFNN